MKLLRQSSEGSDRVPQAIASGWKSRFLEALWASMALDRSLGLLHTVSTVLFLPWEAASLCP